MHPKNKPQQASEQDGPESQSDHEEKQKHLTLEKSEVLNLLLQMRELVRSLVSYDDPSQ